MKTKILSLVLALTAFCCRSMVAQDNCPDLSVLKVGTDASAGLNPYDFLGTNNSWQGFDKAVMCELRKRLGVNTLDVQQVAYGDLLDALSSDRIDVIISDFSIIPSAEKSAAWVKYNDDVLGMVLTRAVFNDLGQPTGATILSVLAKAGFNVDVNPNRREQGILNANGITDAHIFICPSAETAVARLKSGGVAAYFTDNAVAQQVVSEDSSLVLVSNVIDPTNNAATQSKGLGIGVRPECCQLYVNIAAAIASMVADGTLKALRDQFDTGTFTPADLTPASCQGTEPDNPERNNISNFIFDKFCPCNPVVNNVTPLGTCEPA